MYYIIFGLMNHQPFPHPIHFNCYALTQLHSNMTRQLYIPSHCNRTWMHSCGRGSPSSYPHTTSHHNSPTQLPSLSPINFHPPNLHIYSFVYQRTLIPHLTASHPTLPPSVYKSPIYISDFFINCTELQYLQECSCIMYIIHHQSQWKVSVITAWGVRWTGLPHSTKTNCDHLMKDIQVPILSVDFRSSVCGGVPSIGLPMLWLHSPSIMINNCMQQSSNTFLNNHPSCLYIFCRTLNEDAIYIADYTGLVSCSAYGLQLMYCFTV